MQAKEILIGAAQTGAQPNAPVHAFYSASTAGNGWSAHNDVFAYNYRMATELLYFHDPMCSWCWAFRHAFTALHARLPGGLTLRRVVGGLAPDND
jgi:hypothetical protein